MYAMLRPQLYDTVHVQSTLIISNSKGLSKIFRDIRTLTYQVGRIKEK